jgi:hypothetical protein
MYKLRGGPNYRKSGQLILRYKSCPGFNACLIVPLVRDWHQRFFCCAETWQPAAPLRRLGAGRGIPRYLRRSRLKSRHSRRRSSRSVRRRDDERGLQACLTILRQSKWAKHVRALAKRSKRVRYCRRRYLDDGTDQSRSVILRVSSACR